MGKIKKQKDGMYYEKIVTWKKKPEYFFIYLGIFMMVLGIVLVFVFRHALEIDNLSLGSWNFFALVIGIGILTGGNVFGGLLLIFFLCGEGKKIKFKRINS